MPRSASTNVLDIEGLQLLKLSDATQYFGVNQDQLRVMCATGEVKGVIKRNGRWLIPLHSIRAWQSNNKYRP